MAVKGPKNTKTGSGWEPKPSGDKPSKGQVPSKAGSIQSLEPVWKARFDVRSYDIDFRSRLRISSLCGFFQDIAGSHAEHLGVGYQHMLESRRAWVLSRLYIMMHDYPAWKDELTIETWPTGMERLFFRRDFEVYRGRQKMISAVSYWLALDTTTMRPQVFPIDEAVISHNAGRFALEGGMDSIPSPAGESQETASREVRYSEIDQNRHVNNTRYIEWIMDQFEINRLDASMPQFLAVEYRHEVKAQDVVRIRKAPDPEDVSAIIVEGMVEASRRVCFRAKVIF